MLQNFRQMNPVIAGLMLPVLLFVWLLSSCNLCVADTVSQTGSAHEHCLQQSMANQALADCCDHLDTSCPLCKADTVAKPLSANPDAGAVSVIKLPVILSDLPLMPLPSATVEADATVFSVIPPPTPSPLYIRHCRYLI